MRAFLFDLDDTLFDHRHSTRAALAVLREQLPPLASVPADTLEDQHGAVLEEFHRRVLAGEMDVDLARRERFRRLVEMHGGSATATEIDGASRAYRHAYIDARRAVVGALELLGALRPHGSIGIVSNNVTAEQMAKLAACGLDRLIDAAVISEDAGVTKPDPEIFRIALNRLGARPTDAVMIGDSWEADVVGAHAAGIRAIWFNPLRRPCPDPSLICAEIESLQPAAEVLQKILGC
jgi:putative hydrolase of the HAD superfamily